MTPKQDSARLLDAVGPAFSRLRRSVLLDVENPVSAKDLSRTLVLNIVEQGEDVAVGDVAERLGIDPSVASRMVSDCIAADYLIRAASQRDGRRTVLRLTPDGTATLKRFRQHQRAAFEYVTREWTERDRLEFARLLLKYVDAMEALRGRDG
jgi:DNA-binding MarR family transcriptional regulator